MKLTFTINRTSDNKFRVLILEEDPDTFTPKHIEVMDTLEEAFSLAKDREHYKNRPSDGFETDEDRQDFWDGIEGDEVLFDSYVNPNSRVQYAVLGGSANRKELRLLMRFLEEMEGENK